MAVVVEELPTVERSFGFDPLDLVTVGDFFQHRFIVQDPDDCTLADFSGYTPAFDILDSAGAIVLSGTVVPSPGDNTGTFLVSLTTAQTTTLGEANYAYRLRIDDGGGTVKTLFCGQFNLTLCKAAA